MAGKELTPEAFAIKAQLVLNLRALLKLADGEPGEQRLINLGIATGSAQRALDSDSMVRVSLLAQLAKAFKMEPWQLLAPNAGRGIDQLTGQQGRLLGFAEANGGPAEIMRRLQGEDATPAPAQAPAIAAKKRRMSTG